MNRINENLWPVASPPPGFADATVERMLAASSVTHPVHGRDRRLTGLLLAAILVTGAAFGIHAGAKKVGGGVVEPAMPLQRNPSMPMQQRMARIVTPSHSPLSAPSAPQASGRPLRPLSSALPMPASSVAPSTVPRIPGCQCQRGFADMICDCY